jgi:hypothetical protein
VVMVTLVWNMFKGLPCSGCNSKNNKSTLITTDVSHISDFIRSPIRKSTKSSKAFIALDAHLAGCPCVAPKGEEAQTDCVFTHPE